MNTVGSILDVLRGPWAWAFPLPEWKSWHIFHATCYGLASQLCQEDQNLARRWLNRATLPQGAAARDIWGIFSRRAGKTHGAHAVIGGYEACFQDHSAELSKGEKGVVMIATPTIAQSRILLDYIWALISNTPMLASLDARRLGDAIYLNNDISIEILAANYRTLRGRTVVTALIDESAFLDAGDSAQSDEELIRAVLPAMSTIPSAKLVVLSSPFGKSGELFKKFERHYGVNNDPVLFWKATSREMHPSLPASLVDEAMASDPEAARSEWLSEWRDSSSSLLSYEIVQAHVAVGRHELAPQAGLSYHAATDFASGAVTAKDHAAVCVTHREADLVYVDAIRDVAPPFSPKQLIAEEFAPLLKAYGISSVVGDRFAVGFAGEAWAEQGIEYTLSDKSSSQLLLEIVPIMMSGGRIELLDDKVSIAQLCNLTRRVASGGREHVAAAGSGHDDAAVTIAMAILAALNSPAGAMIDRRFRSCWKSMGTGSSVKLGDCLLYGGPHFPSRADPSCGACHGLSWVRQARASHFTRTGEQIDLRIYVEQHCTNNEHMAKVKSERWASRMAI